MDSNDIADTYAGEALFAILEWQIGHDDFAGAKATVEDVKQLGDDSEALATLGLAQAAKGDLKAAKETFGGITKASAWMPWPTLAAKQVKIGDLAGAKAMIKSMPDEEGRASVLKAVARAQALTGDVAGVTETLRSLKGEYRLSKPWITALAQTKAGDLAAARATLARQEAPSNQRSAWASIANCLIENGEREATQKVCVEELALLNAPSFHGTHGTSKEAGRTDLLNGLWQVARDQARADNLAGTKETLAALDKKLAETRPILAATRLSKYAQRRRYTHQEILEDEQQYCVLPWLELARAQLRAGDRAAATQSLQEATAAANTATGIGAEYYGGNAKTYGELAAANAEAIGCEETERWIAALPDPQHRACAYAAFAEARSRADHPPVKADP